MHNYNGYLLIILLLTLSTIGADAATTYSQRLCKNPNFCCLTIQKNQSWHSLWPDAKQRELIMRLNRMNVQLRPGMKVAIPMNMDEWTNIMPFAPFPVYIGPQAQDIFIFDPNELAWGAYNQNGELVRWGPASGGKDWCEDIQMSCITVPGEFNVYYRRNENCVSKTFPIGKGGAPMPYCMFYYQGYAIHGSNQVPGFNASHGCIRVYNEDAKWLANEFIQAQQQTTPTKIIIMPYQ